MYQLLLKQKFRFIIRMVKRNISVYIALAVVLPGMVLLESVMRGTFGMNIALLIPYGTLCYLFMNLFSSIPRIRISGLSLPACAPFWVNTNPGKRPCNKVVVLATGIS